MRLMEFLKECTDAAEKLIDWLENKGWGMGGRGLLAMIRDFIYFIQGLSIYGEWEVIQGFTYDWVFSRVKLNVDITIWFMGPQEKHLL